jgi:hypothetical protein
MKPFYVVIIVISLLGLYGCQSVCYKPGQLMVNGKVAPCDDWRTNPQTCGEAIYNAPRIRQLNLGQSMQQTREIMGRDPEERSLKTQDGRPVEIWGYLTEYDKSIVSVITFVESRIVSIEATQR